MTKDFLWRLKLHVGNWNEWSLVLRTWFRHISQMTDDIATALSCSSISWTSFCVQRFNVDTIKGALYHTPTEGQFWSAFLFKNGKSHKHTMFNLRREITYIKSSLIGRAILREGRIYLFNNTRQIDIGKNIQKVKRKRQITVTVVVAQTISNAP